MKKIIFYTLIATLIFPLITKAEDIALPVITKPVILEEGTQRDLSAAQIAELLPWAKDSKNFLNDMLDTIQGLSMADKIDRLVEGIHSIVSESAPKNSELLMRYALNRGLAINDIIARETSVDAVGIADAKVRVLILSVKMAIKYYDTDMATLTNKTAAPFVVFGLDYFNFLNEINKSIFDASAEYAIQRASLEWLQWDLYRDLNNAQYAPQIVKINNNLKLFPTKKLTDAQSIAYIRQMKKISQQLDLNVKVQTANVTDLRKGVAAIRTVGKDHYHVIIREIYADKMVDVEYTDVAYKGQHATIALSTLSLPLQRLGDLTPDVSAIRTSGGNHYHVIIREIFADEMVDVEYTDASYKGQHGTVSYNDLSFSVKRLDDLNVGASAIRTSGGNHYHVIIREIFADGNIDVEYTDASYKGQHGTVKPSDLSLPIDG
ncbi:MAG: hypothetical protein PHY93_15320 [Bacteriovorax sp.]|nr:hypothetical protein [Bacteriovorax sp.]